MMRNPRTIRIVFVGLLILAGAVTLLCFASLLRGNEPAHEAKRLLGRFRFVPPTETSKSPDPRVKYLGKENPFTPKKSWSSGRLVGVLGDLAFFENGPALKVGDKHNGAKIRKIGPNWVEMDVEGNPKKVYVTSGGPSSGPSPGGGRMRVPRGIPSPGPRSSGPPPGFKLTPEMIERFKKLPPDIRAKALQNMPPEIREQLQKAL